MGCSVLNRFQSFVVLPYINAILLSLWVNDSLGGRQHIHASGRISDCFRYWVAIIPVHISGRSEGMGTKNGMIGECFPWAGCHYHSGAR